MKGHDAIIKMRTVHRLKPEAVYLNDFPCLTGFLDRQSTVPVVCVHRDPIETLDLRFLVGLKVQIIGDTEARAQKLFDASVNAGAAYVASCWIADSRYYTDSFLKVWSKEDGVIYG